MPSRRGRARWTCRRNRRGASVKDMSKESRRSDQGAEEPRVRTLAMAQWCALAREGCAPPVTIPLEGDSMRPLIRRGRDPVTIVPVGGALKKGDVALFTLGDGRYVVHRIWKLRGGFVRTLGDNCACPEPWFPREQVLGVAIAVERDGRRIDLKSGRSRLWGRLWMAGLPMRRVSIRTRAMFQRAKAVFSNTQRR